MRKALWVIVPLLLLIGFLPQIGSTFLLRGFFNRAFSKKFHADASIQTIRLSWLGPQRFIHIALKSKEMVGLIGTLKSEAPFWHLSSIGNDFAIEEGTFTFPSRRDSALKNVSAQLHDHTLLAQGEAVPQGNFTLTGKIYSDRDFDITFDLQQIPTLALDQLLTGKNFLNQILGDLIDASGSLLLHQTKGSLSLDLSSPNIQTSLKSTLDSEFLTLETPFRASFQLTPELADALMGHVNPLFLTSLEATEPIELQIQPEGFRFPWQSFDLQKLAIGEATLNMGKVICQNGKSLSSLIALFKGFQKSDQTEIWFTPLSFSLTNRILETGRMDALIANAIHLCTWGKIDLGRDELEMTLGLCADTLAQSFGIENLPRSYVLKIPLRGSTENPDLDSAAATAKIGALVAMSQIPKMTGVPKLFRGPLNLITQSLENQDDVPPPRRPFPWER